MFTARDIVIMSVDRSQPDIILVNTAVDFLHCPIQLSKSMLRTLGYTVYRPQKIKPLIHAVIFRQAERHASGKWCCWRWFLTGHVVKTLVRQAIPRV